jgi:methylmalonyl-CoA/ethylmalonyl-CoA epimerase
MNTTAAMLPGPPPEPKISDLARLHHIGFVVGSISDEIYSFAKAVETNWDQVIFHDPLQRARVAFLRPACPTDALIELVEPAGEGSPILQFLQKGGGLHHLCYEVPDLEAHLHAMRVTGAVIVKRPRPAVAFANRRVAWMVTAQKLLLEFLEVHPGGSLLHEAKEVIGDSIG